MTLTKKHYIAIADILNKKIELHKNNNHNKVLVLTELTQDLSNYFKNDNPLFNEFIFKKRVLRELFKE